MICDFRNSPIVLEFLSLKPQPRMLPMLSRLSWPWLGRSRSAWELPLLTTSRLCRSVRVRVFNLDPQAVAAKGVMVYTCCSMFKCVATSERQKGYSSPAPGGGLPLYRESFRSLLGFLIRFPSPLVWDDCLELLQDSSMPLDCPANVFLHAISAGVLNLSMLAVRRLWFLPWFLLILPFLRRLFFYSPLFLRSDSLMFVDLIVKKINPPLGR